MRIKFHYHLHVIAIPVVKKEIKNSKRTKDKSLYNKKIMKKCEQKKYKSCKYNKKIFFLRITAFLIIKKIKYY